jgi:ArsR family transcriptional regulator
MRIYAYMNESAKLFAGLCHPARLEILEALIKSKGCVSELQLRTGRNQPNLSQHLRVLRYAGLVDFRKDGKRACYFVSRPEVAQLLKIAKEMYPEGKHG